MSSFLREKKATKSIVAGVLSTIGIFLSVIFIVAGISGAIKDGLTAFLVICTLLLAFCVWRLIVANKKIKKIKSENAQTKKEYENAKASNNMWWEFSCGKLQPANTEPFIIAEKGIYYGKDLTTYERIQSFNMVTAPSPIVLGVVQMEVEGLLYILPYRFKDRELMAHAFDYATQQIKKSNGEVLDYKYRIVSHTGTTLEVYDKHVIINHMRTGGLVTAAANILTGGGTGNKRIQIADITTIQFKEPAGITVGFIQFSYPGSVETRGAVSDAFDDENAIPISPENLALAREVVNYIEKRREELRSPNGTVIQQLSSADELKKYKDLLDQGIISQEEFDAKKKQLLGL